MSEDGEEGEDGGYAACLLDLKFSGRTVNAAVAMSKDHREVDLSLLLGMRYLGQGKVKVEAAGSKAQEDAEGSVQKALVAFRRDLHEDGVLTSRALLALERELVDVW